MANMSYCRFQNTLLALKDCRNELRDEPLELSPEEAKAAMQLIRVCSSIVENADEYLDDIAFGQAEAAEPPNDACPGCGCEPGDGITESCDAEDGCGFHKAERDRTVDTMPGSFGGPAVQS